MTQTAKLKVKVVPGASKSEIVGWLGDALKVRVAAAPEKGKANAAVEALIAEALGLPASSVQVVTGMTSRQKVIEVSGLSQEEVDERFR